MKNKEQRNLIRIDRRGVVWSCVPYVTNSPSRISIFSYSRSQALCPFVCCFSLFFLSLLYVYRCLSVCCLCTQSYLCFLSLSISHLLSCFQRSPSFSYTLFFSLFFLFTIPLFLCLHLFLQPCRVTSLFVHSHLNIQKRQTQKQHAKKNMHTYVYVYICK